MFWFVTAEFGHGLGFSTGSADYKLALAMYLDVDSVRLQLALGAHLLVVLAVPLGEAPLLRDVDLRISRLHLV